MPAPRLQYLWLAFCLAAPVAAVAEPGIRYPIVFNDASRLQEVGIAFALYGAPETQHFPNKCYAYGDGGHRISVSDAMLARYKAKGFSLQSLCLGLVSEARFDPESGRRLATYVVVNEPELRRALNGRDPKTMTERQLAECCSEGFISPELPLVVPACFKGGTPYSDCAWRFGLKTGVTIAGASTQRFREFGRALDTGMASAMRGDLRDRKSVV